MRAEWTPLGSAASTAVDALLHAAQRAVAAREPSWAAAAGEAVRKLRSRIARGQPFPPAASAGRSAATRRYRRRRLVAGVNGVDDPDEDDEEDLARAEELSLDVVVAAAAAERRKLGPLEDAVAILRAELKRLESDLEHDMAAVEDLEKNVKDEAVVTREGLRRAHKLVLGIDGARGAGSGEDDFGGEDDDHKLYRADGSVGKLYQVSSSGQWLGSCSFQGQC